MGVRSWPVLLLALPHATALLVRAGLAHGYKEDFQYVGKFGFSASTEELPAKIRLLAWTFIPGQRLLIYKNDDWFQAYNDEPERAVLTGEGVQTRLSSLCERRAALATVSLPVAQGAFYGEAGEVIEQDIVQEEPAFWFLALARCQEWVDALENATAGADKCMGSRQYGNVPNGVFMYYELRLYNPECAGGPTCSYWTKELSVDEHGLYEMHLFFVSMLGWLLLAQVVTMLCRWSSQTLFAMPQLAALTTGTRPRKNPAQNSAQFSDGRSTISSTAVECLRHALAIFYYSHLAATGLPRPWALLTASCCEYVATVLLTMLVLMLAKVAAQFGRRYSDAAQLFCAIIL